MVHLKRSRRVHKHVRSLPADPMLHYGFGAGSISSSSAMCRSTASATRASSAARRRFAFPVGGDEHAADQRQAVDLHADPFGLTAARGVRSGDAEVLLSLVDESAELLVARCREDLL